ncbi:sulfate adenylyltransferase subunit CysD [Methylocystis parvus]|uniref:sulfate adenylyltransferase subunit CysD n=1 Tax=Methylocystis parvus TaxID=134 RepID=UPI003C790A0F
MGRSLSHLAWLEAEAIHILRETTAEAENPVMLFSAGKDSTVLAHLALRAFYPSKPPFPLLHIDSTWEFQSLLDFRDRFARENGFRLIAYANEEGRAAGMNPFDYGDRYTLVMRTEPLKAALNAGKYDVVFGGARRDEERARAKERIVSIRDDKHVWDPRQQRPEFGRMFNLRLGRGQSARVFPLSNWTEQDIWNYALENEIELAPLYFTEERPVVQRKGAFVVVDDEARMRFEPGDRVEMRRVRFRTLGCWPVTGAIESEATDIAAVLDETLNARFSERQGRISDGEDGGSLEQKKREGYF